MVQEEKPKDHHDNWDPENDEEEDEDQFPEDVGPPENNMQLLFQNLAMALPNQFLDGGHFDIRRPGGFAEHYQRHLMEERGDEDDNDSLPDLLDDPHVINDPLEGGRELDDNQMERLAMEQVVLEEMGYHFEEDEEDHDDDLEQEDDTSEMDDDPEIRQAYEHQVNNGQNPGFIEGFYAYLEAMEDYPGHVEDLEQEDQSGVSEEGEGDEEEEVDQDPAPALAPAYYLCPYHRDQRDLERARQELPPAAPANNQVSIFDFIETSSDEDDDDEEAEDSLTRSQFYIELV